MGLLRRSSDEFKNSDERNDLTSFCVCGLKAPEYCRLTYFFLYAIHRRPEGDLEYGSHAFLHHYGKSSTDSDRFQAIDLTLSLFAQYEQSLILQEAQRLYAQAYEGSWEQWWNDNKDKIATVAAVGGAAITIGGALFSLIRGGASPAERVTIPADRIVGFLPGHVVVGGGHFDGPLQQLAMFGQMQNRFPQPNQPVEINPHKFQPGHVLVGGGHMDSIQQQFASQIKQFTNYARETNSSSQYQVVLCKKKHKESNDNNNNNNAVSTQERGNVKGGFQVNQDSNGNLYAQAGVTAEVKINENVNVGVNGNGWINQNGDYGGGAGVGITISF